MTGSEIFQTLGIILTAGAATVLLRAFPFIAFSGKRGTPPLVRYLGTVISPAAIAMLIVYCIGSHWQTPSALRGGAEIIAGLLVVGLQYRKRNPLLSILAGTAVYMLLVQNF